MNGWLSIFFPVETNLSLPLLHEHDYISILAQGIYIYFILNELISDDRISFYSSLKGVERSIWLALLNEKNKDGSTRSYLRKGFNYDTYIDGLLQFSDIIIYLFETKREREHFLKKGSFSKRVFSGLIDKPETLYDLNNKPIKISDVLSGE